ncbi:hypothetical protein [Mycolicibacterium palauense]|uniref:hypothetical protein n=1 Tax=Mycolicibacterium palauense TaxID=2034511 RepID=UPI000BFEF1A4|nr:hypothetical protein [Mycolicibacterium palauense]
MSYKLPDKEIEKILRIVKTNCQIHIENVKRLPQDAGDESSWHSLTCRDSVISHLTSAIDALDLYAMQRGVEILRTMPT